jgi:hypothetical protein
MLTTRTSGVPETSSRRDTGVRRARRLCAKTTNNPATRFSLHTAEGRRARDLYEAFVSGMEGPGDTVRLCSTFASVTLGPAVPG